MQDVLNKKVGKKINRPIFSSIKIYHKLNCDPLFISVKQKYCYENFKCDLIEIKKKKYTVREENIRSEMNFYQWLVLSGS